MILVQNKLTFFFLCKDEAMITCIKLRFFYLVQIVGIDKEIKRMYKLGVEESVDRTKPCKAGFMESN
jgi:Na+-transporting NADH:ubiquinone oxidoreductase subunit NqrE